VGDNDASNDTVDRALRLFVYGPVGLACYLKDSAPTFMDVFVSRGKREVDGVRKVVEEKLGFAKTEPEPAPSPQQRMADSIGSLTKVAAQATSMMASMAGPVVNAATNAASTVTSSRPDDGSGAMTPPAYEPATPAPASTSPFVGAEAGVTNGAPEATNGSGPDLPIPGYDGLSASQVIERLDGLSRGALERVRLYELAHRARRTILASIDQLTS